MKGKYLGMDWKITEEKTHYGLRTTIGIRISDNTHMFRHGGVTVESPIDDTDEFLNEVIGIAQVGLIVWMDKIFFRYEAQSKFKRFLIRHFGYKYENAIRLFGKWYLQIKQDVDVVSANSTNKRY